MGLWGILVWILSVIAAVFVIVNVWTKHKHWHVGRKLVWTILALIPAITIVTAIVYYFVEYKK